MGEGRREHKKETRTQQYQHDEEQNRTAKQSGG
jgi:hypothetical protein